MIIDDLPSISIANDSDEIAIEQGTATKKITKGNFLQEVTSAISSLISDISGKVSKAGDTMTGNLYISKSFPGVGLRSTMTDGTAPSSATNQYGFSVRDKNDANIALFTDRWLANGTQGAWMAGYRSGVANSLYLFVDANGDPIVDLNSPAAWRSALGLGTSGALPITVAQGGTGAITADGAASNLNLTKRYSINNGSAITTSIKRRISFANVVNGLLFVCGSSNARCGAYVVYGSTTTVIVKPISEATACTITTGTGHFDITSTSGSLYASIMIPLGALSNISESSVT